MAIQPTTTTPSLFSFERIRQNYDQMGTKTKVVSVATPILSAAAAIATAVATGLGHIAVTIGGPIAALTAGIALIAFAMMFLKTPEQPLVSTPNPSLGQRFFEAGKDALNYARENPFKTASGIATTSAALAATGRVAYTAARSTEPTLRGKLSSSAAALASDLSGVKTFVASRLTALFQRT